MKKKKKRFNWRRKNCYISKFLGIGKNGKKKFDEERTVTFRKSQDLKLYIQ